MIIFTLATSQIICVSSDGTKECGLEELTSDQKVKEQNLAFVDGNVYLFAAGVSLTLPAVISNLEVEIYTTTTETFSHSGFVKLSENSIGFSTDGEAYLTFNKGSGVYEGFSFPAITIKADDGKQIDVIYDSKPTAMAIEFTLSKNSIVDFDYESWQEADEQALDDYDLTYADGDGNEATAKIFYPTLITSTVQSQSGMTFTAYGPNCWGDCSAAGRFAIAEPADFATAYAAAIAAQTAIYVSKDYPVYQADIDTEFLKLVATNDPTALILLNAAFELSLDRGPFDILDYYPVQTETLTISTSTTETLKLTDPTDIDGYETPFVTVTADIEVVFSDAGEYCIPAYFDEFDLDKIKKLTLEYQASALFAKSGASSLKYTISQMDFDSYTEIIVTGENPSISLSLGDISDLDSTFPITITSDEVDFVTAFDDTISFSLQDTASFKSIIPTTMTTTHSGATTFDHVSWIKKLPSQSSYIVTSATDVVSITIGDTFAIEYDDGSTTTETLSNSIQLHIDSTTIEVSFTELTAGSMFDKFTFTMEDGSSLTFDDSWTESGQTIPAARFAAGATLEQQNAVLKVPNKNLIEEDGLSEFITVQAPVTINCWGDNSGSAGHESHECTEIPGDFAEALPELISDSAEIFFHTAKFPVYPTQYSAIINDPEVSALLKDCTETTLEPLIFYKTTDFKSLPTDSIATMFGSQTLTVEKIELSIPTSDYDNPPEGLIIKKKAEGGEMIVTITQWSSPLTFPTIFTSGEITHVILGESLTGTLSLEFTLTAIIAKYDGENAFEFPLGTVFTAPCKIVVSGSQASDIFINSETIELTSAMTSITIKDISALALTATDDNCKPTSIVIPSLESLSVPNQGWLALLSKRDAGSIKCSITGTDATLVIGQTSNILASETITNNLVIDVIGTLSISLTNNAGLSKLTLSANDEAIIKLEESMQEAGLVITAAQGDVEIQTTSSDSLHDDVLASEYFTVIYTCNCWETTSGYCQTNNKIKAKTADDFAMAYSQKKSLTDTLDADSDYPVFESDFKSDINEYATVETYKRLIYLAADNTIDVDDFILANYFPSQSKTLTLSNGVLKLVDPKAGTYPNKFVNVDDITIEIELSETGSYSIPGLLKDFASSLIEKLTIYAGSTISFSQDNGDLVFGVDGLQFLSDTEVVVKSDSIKSITVASDELTGLNEAEYTVIVTCDKIDFNSEFDSIVKFDLKGTSAFGGTIPANFITSVSGETIIDSVKWIQSLPDQEAYHLTSDADIKSIRIDDKFTITLSSLPIQIPVIVDISISITTTSIKVSYAEPEDSFFAKFTFVMKDNSKLTFDSSWSTYDGELDSEHFDGDDLSGELATIIVPDAKLIGEGLHTNIAKELPVDYNCWGATNLEHETHLCTTDPEEFAEMLASKLTTTGAEIYFHDNDFPAYPAQWDLIAAEGQTARLTNCGSGTLKHLVYYKQTDFDTLADIENIENAFGSQVLRVKAIALEIPNEDYKDIPTTLSIKPSLVGGEFTVAIKEWDTDAPALSEHFALTDVTHVILADTLKGTLSLAYGSSDVTATYADKDPATFSTKAIFTTPGKIEVSGEKQNCFINSATVELKAAMNEITIGGEIESLTITATDDGCLPTSIDIPEELTSVTVPNQKWLALLTKVDAATIKCTIVGTEATLAIKNDKYTIATKGIEVESALVLTISGTLTISSDGETDDSTLSISVLAGSTIVLDKSMKGYGFKVTAPAEGTVTFHIPSTDSVDSTILTETKFKFLYICDCWGTEDSCKERIKAETPFEFATAYSQKTVPSTMIVDGNYPVFVGDFEKDPAGYATITGTGDEKIYLKEDATTDAAEFVLTNYFTIQDKEMKLTTGQLNVEYPVSSFTPFVTIEGAVTIKLTFKAVGEYKLPTFIVGDYAAQVKALSFEKEATLMYANDLKFSVYGMTFPTATAIESTGVLKLATAEELTAPDATTIAITASTVDFVSPFHADITFAFTGAETFSGVVPTAKFSTGATAISIPFAAWLPACPASVESFTVRSSIGVSTVTIDVTPKLGEIDVTKPVVFHVTSSIKLSHADVAPEASAVYDRIKFLIRDGMRLSFDNTWGDNKIGSAQFEADGEIVNKISIFVPKATLISGDELDTTKFTITTITQNCWGTTPAAPTELDCTRNVVEFATALSLLLTEPTPENPIIFVNTDSVVPVFKEDFASLTAAKIATYIEIIGDFDLVFKQLYSDPEDSLTVNAELVEKLYPDQDINVKALTLSLPVTIPATLNFKCTGTLECTIPASESEIAFPAAALGTIEVPVTFTVSEASSTIVFDEESFNIQQVTGIQYFDKLTIEGKYLTLDATADAPDSLKTVSLIAESLKFDAEIGDTIAFKVTTDSITGDIPKDIEFVAVDEIAAPLSWIKSLEEIEIVTVIDQTYTALLLDKAGVIVRTVTGDPAETVDVKRSETTHFILSKSLTISTEEDPDDGEITDVTVGFILNDGVFLTLDDSLEIIPPSQAIPVTSATEGKKYVIAMLDRMIEVEENKNIKSYTSETKKPCWGTCEEPSENGITEIEEFITELTEVLSLTEIEYAKIVVYGDFPVTATQYGIDLDDKVEQLGDGAKLIYLEGEQAAFAGTEITDAILAQYYPEQAVFIPIESAVTIGALTAPLKKLFSLGETAKITHVCGAAINDIDVSELFDETFKWNAVTTTIDAKVDFNAGPGYYTLSLADAVSAHLKSRLVSTQDLSIKPLSAQLTDGELGSFDVKATTITFTKGVSGNFNLEVSAGVHGDVPDSGDVAISGDAIVVDAQWFVATTKGTVSTLTVQGATELIVTPTGVKINGVERPGKTIIAVTTSTTVKYEQDGDNNAIFNDINFVITTNDVVLTIDESFSNSNAENALKISAEKGVTGSKITSPSDKFINVTDEEGGLDIDTPGDDDGGDDGLSTGAIVAIVVVVVVVVIAVVAGALYFFVFRKKDDDDGNVTTV